MQLVYPKNSTGRDPAIIWLHGGGWSAGNRTLTPGLDRWFAAEGFVMVSIDYRLSGQATFPAPLFDVRAAIRHLRQNSNEYGVDPLSIGLWGSSAGGHLAALAALSGHVHAFQDEPEQNGSAFECSVQAVADCYGPTDLSASQKSAVSLPGQSAIRDLLGGRPEERPDLAAMASPTRWVTQHAPPFLLAHGEADVLVPASESRQLHNQLRAIGVESTLYILRGYQHGFLNPADTPDIASHPLFDAGRLAAEGQAPSEVFCNSSAPKFLPPDEFFSFDTIGRFFNEHLRQRS